jgi:tetratricopeptide (TPR) repeat protein
MQQRQGDKRRLGEILVALGVITQREVERQVRFQIEEVVFEVMSWNEGYFSFNEEPAKELPSGVAVRIPVEALLMEGARRIDEWSRIEGRIPHVGVVPSLAPPPEGGGELDLLPPEWEVLALIDGQRAVRALATELGRSDFEVAKTLFGLESAGVIVLVDPGTAKRGRTGPSAMGDLAELVAKAEQALQAKDFDAARAAAEQAANMQPHDASVHLLLGRIHLAQGRGPAATEELRRALRLDPLLAAAHRQLGFALIAIGRFGEALESWDQWERLAPRGADELAQLPDVQRARDAARVFLGMRAGSHG